MPPKYLLEKTVPQCRDLADAVGENNPFSAPVLHFPAAIPAADQRRLHEELIAVVDGGVRPAYKKLERFIAAEYAPQGRLDEGYWALPNGEERYRFNVHTQTTSNLTPEQIHALGLAQVADIEAEILALAKKAGFQDSKTFTKSVLSDPKEMAASREQILESYRHYISEMEPKLPQLFGRLPKGTLLVTSVPEYQEKDGSTEYMQGTPDGSRPAQVGFGPMTRNTIARWTMKQRHTTRAFPGTICRLPSSWNCRCAVPSRFGQHLPARIR